MSNIQKYNDTLNGLIQLLGDIEKVQKSFKLILGDYLSESDQFIAKCHRSTHKYLSNIQNISEVDFKQILVEFGQGSKQFLEVCQKDIQENLKFQKTQVVEYFDKQRKGQQICLDNLNNNLREINQSYQSYQRNLQKYEKMYKDTDAQIAEKEKVMQDASQFYNMTLQAKYKLKFEQQIKDIEKKEAQLLQQVEDQNQLIKASHLNCKQYYEDIKPLLRQTFQKFLSCGQHLVQSSIERYKKSIKLVAEREQALSDLVARKAQPGGKAPQQVPPKTSQAQPESGTGASLQQAPQTSQQQPQTSQQQEEEQQLSENETVIECFLEIYNKTIVKGVSLTEGELQVFPEITTKYISITQENIQNRINNYQNLRQYVQDLFDSIGDSLVRVNGKLSKVQVPLQGESLSSPGVQKKNHEFFEILVGVIQDREKRTQQLQNYIQVKLAIIEGLIKEQKEQQKNLQNVTTKVIQDLKEIQKKDLRKFVEENVQIIMIYIGTFENFEQQRIESIQQTIKEIYATFKQDLSDYLQVLAALLDRLRDKSNSFTLEIDALFSTDETLRQYEAAMSQTEEQYSQSKLKFTTFPSLNEKNVFDSNLLSEENMSLYKETEESEMKDEKPEDPNSTQEPGGQAEKGRDESPRADRPAEEKEGRLSKDFADDVDAEEAPAGGLQHQGQSLDASEQLSPTAKRKDKYNNISHSLRMQFGVKDSDVCVFSCSCALQYKILLQGRMYVFKDRICFHSYFNNKNILIGSTILVIPMSDVTGIEKKANAIIFDNCLTIFTKRGKVRFATLLHRGKTIQVIQQMAGKEFINDEEAKNKLSDDISATKQADKAPADKAPADKSPAASLDITAQQQGTAALGQSQTLTLNPATSDKDKELPQLVQSQSVTLSGKDAPPKQEEGPGSVKKQMSVQDQLILNPTPVKSGQDGVLAEAPKKAEASPDSKSSKQKKAEEEAKKKQLISLQKAEAQKQKDKSKKQSSKAPEPVVQEPVVQLQKPQGSEQLAAMQPRVLSLSKAPPEIDFSQRSARLSAMSRFKDVPMKLSQVKFRGISAREVFIYFLSNKPYEYNGTKYGCYLEAQMIAQEQKNIVITAYNAPLPEVFDQPASSNFQQLLGYQDAVERRWTFIQPIKEKIPFAPKQCEVEQVEKVMFLSDTEVIVEKETFVKKVPMSDVFTALNLYHVKEVGDECVCSFNFHINFVKSSMFKSTIKSSNEKNQQLSHAQFEKFLSREIHEFIQKKQQSQPSGSQSLAPQQAQGIAEEKILRRNSVVLKDEGQDQQREIEKLTKQVEEQGEQIKQLTATLGVIKIALAVLALLSFINLLFK